MPPRYNRIAVIGTGPSGLSAVKALHDEQTFTQIRVFERRDRVGGLWHYDPTPDPFPDPALPPPIPNAIPAGQLPRFAPPAPEDTTARTAIYDTLDSNVGAKTMAFTHTAFPEVNSALSIKQFGAGNASRPFRVVAGYLEDLFRAYLHLVSFSTTVERVEKKGDVWVVTLRKTDQLRRGVVDEDYWWQEEFDAVVVASGHYNVPLIPEVKGLEGAFRERPGVFEHSKAFRSADDYVGKRVVVVGGNISSADIVAELHRVVGGPLYLSQRGKNEALDNAWNLPNVERKTTIEGVESTASGVNVRFSDGEVLEDVDKIIWATGYRLSYPFLTPDPVTPNNRVAGFYEHIFKIGDPSLTLVGQVRAGISFRVYEYQAVAVARYFADRNAKPLPSPQAQDLWELERLNYKGPTALFHEVKPDFKQYFEFLRELAGPAAEGSLAYDLQPWEDRWTEQAFELLQSKDKYWKSLQKAAEAESGGLLKAKL